MNQIIRICFPAALLLGATWTQRAWPQSSRLQYPFDGRYGQVEAGGRFAGAEFHRSRPLPSRISFYYPVANSIDLSTDYWKRDESCPMAIGIRVGGGPTRWLGREGWAYVLSPHRVRFSRSEDGLDCTIAYEFCFNEPAMVVSITIRNSGLRPTSVDLYTHLKTSLRTCQTYARFDSAWTESDGSHSALTFHFEQPQADHAVIVVQNVGQSPSSWTTSASELAVTDSGTSRWLETSASFLRHLFPRGTPGDVAAAFRYGKELQPGDSIAIVQVIASCRPGDVRSLTARMPGVWRSDVDAYDRFVLTKAELEATTFTGDPSIDGSAAWARGILASNIHSINGEFVPMPCPAEYNFFFTHDVLRTDLAAVNFDLARVKRDLLYITSHARDSVIPHAYYWRDDGFKTEYCTPENWNHLWFIIVAASYLRHSLDDSTAEAVFPLVAKSVTEMLRQRGEDGLMHAAAPDWWDIGHREGARAYTTILAIRALREFLFFSSMLDRETSNLSGYEHIADAMQQALEARLWDDQTGYLMNFNGAALDPHYYMGSIVGAAFGLLTPDHARRLVETASRVLLDPRIGVRTVMPADFNTDSLRTFYRFAGNEAGDPYLYINGGVWIHDNAWFAIALQSTGRADDALQFLRATMTLDGVVQSPMGQPAMYEYRYSDARSPEFGKIDKPSFLWAGGFYLYTLYHLMGLGEGEWNLSVAGNVPATFDSVRYSFDLGVPKQVRQWRSSMFGFTADGMAVPSRVIPLQLAQSRRWDIALGPAGSPRLESVNAVVRAARYDKASRRLDVTISSFDGHPVVLRVAAAGVGKRVLVDGKRATSFTVARTKNEVTTELRCTGRSGTQRIAITF